MNEFLISKIVSQANKIRDITKNDLNKRSKELSNEYVELLRLINSEDELHNQFGSSDLAQFFLLYGLRGNESLANTSKKKFEENFKNFLFFEPPEYHYYFPVGYEYKFVKNKKIGTGKIVPFSKLPSSAKKEFKRYRYSGIIDDHNLNDKQYEEFVNDAYFMQINLKCKGNFIARINASKEYQKNKNIFNFLTQNFFYHEEGSTFPHVITDISGICQGSQSHYSDGIHQRSFHITYIEKVNEIMKKKSKNDLERRILSAIGIVGNSNDNSSIEIRFLFCLIAIETLLAGDEPGNLRTRISERVAFLLYDDSSWVYYYKHDLSKDFKITKSFVKTIQLESRTKLSKLIKKLYDKRSAIAHTKKKDVKIDENDYEIARLILLLITIKMIKLLKKGITHIQNKNEHDEKSLEYLITKMKFG